MAHKKIVSAQFLEKHAILIQDVAAKRGEDVSSFVRRACLAELGRLGYLSRGALKALGVDLTPEGSQ